MNPNEIAKKMLEWQQLMAQADELAAEIKAAVLESGKTLVVGSVRATYSGGRRTVDYKAACGRSDEELASAYPGFADYKLIIRYKDIAEIENLDLEPFAIKSEPSVTLKLEMK